jgi:hypothetical protein
MLYPLITPQLCDVITTYYSSGNHRVGQQHYTAACASVQAVATGEGAAFMKEYADLLTACFYPIFRRCCECADDNYPPSRGGVVSLASTAALKCTKQRGSDRHDVSGTSRARGRGRCCQALARTTLPPPL